MNQEENNLVEEFPKPPRYYECFRVDSTHLHEFGFSEPPPIPEVSDVYNSLYEGTFAKSRLPSMATINPLEPVDEHFDYKNEIKRAFRDILSNSLSLLSLSSMNPSDIQIHASTVRASVAQLYKILAKYRKHEGRMSIYNQLQKQLQRAQEIEAILERRLAEYHNQLIEIEKIEQ
mmetsp:Transcript_28888/g.31531  ORF Transcript_28888/g.31531 Transcript_28888/m.31531 type:complete len:175 (+) Transcript_28888:40-564(+)